MSSLPQPDQGAPAGSHRGWLNAASARGLIQDLLVSPVEPAPAATQWVPLTCQQLSELVPRYEILRMLGRGGMGAVYEGRDRELKRKVAIKLLPPELASQEGFAERFRREARTLAQLEHPHIVRVHDAATSPNGHLFFVMEFVQGTDLRVLITRSQQSPQERRHEDLPRKRILEIINQVCAALSYAHASGIVHRDIKPANVLIDDAGQVKLADFGLARPLEQSEDHGPSTIFKNDSDLAPFMTRIGHVMGTREYMAPEVLEGGPSDHRADLYAVGALLYEMLTGIPPQLGVYRAPLPDSRLEQVVRRALNPIPDQRFSSATEMLRALKRCDFLVIPGAGGKAAGALALGGILTALILTNDRHLTTPQWKSTPGKLFYYEAFAYPAAIDSLAQQGGFKGSAQLTSDRADVIPGSLTYTDTQGNTLFTMGNSASIDASSKRQTVSIMTPLAIPPDTKDQIWISFLAQQTAGTTSSFFNVCLWAPDNTIDPPDTNVDPDEILAIGMPSASLRQVWQIWDRGSGSPKSRWAVSPVPTVGVTFLVVRLSLDVQNTKLERSTLWVNPLLDTSPPEAVGLSFVSSDSDLKSLDQIQLLRLGAGLKSSASAASAFRVDEIRIGSTCYSVMPHRRRSSHQ